MASNKLPFSRKVGSVDEKKNFFLSKRLLRPKFCGFSFVDFLLKVSPRFLKAAHSPFESEWETRDNNAICSPQWDLFGIVLTNSQDARKAVHRIQLDAALPARGRSRTSSWGLQLPVDREWLLSFIKPLIKSASNQLDSAFDLSHKPSLNKVERNVL